MLFMSPALFAFFHWLDKISTSRLRGNVAARLFPFHSFLANFGEYVLATSSSSLLMSDDCSGAGRDDEGDSSGAGTTPLRITGSASAVMPRTTVHHIASSQTMPTMHQPGQRRSVCWVSVFLTHTADLGPISLPSVSAGLIMAKIATTSPEAVWTMLVAANRPTRPSPGTPSPIDKHRKNLANTRRTTRPMPYNAIHQLLRAIPVARPNDTCSRFVRRTSAKGGTTSRRRRLPGICTCTRSHPGLQSAAFLLPSSRSSSRAQG